MKSLQSCLVLVVVAANVLLRAVTCENVLVDVTGLELATPSCRSAILPGIA